ncbi:MAG TPA: VWA domain-containing protein [Egibacteraceae bacterium]|nr:VWA domain-containing protein [Egibacteraceae bacterium]
MSFDAPLWLLALPLTGGVVWVTRRHGGKPAWDPSRQHRVATGVRALAVALLVLALAGPRWEAGGRRVDVVFVIDASDSVGPAAAAGARAYVEEAISAAGPDDRAALALFGRDARLEHGLRHDPPPVDPAVVVDGSATDLARALRLGQGAAGSDNRRRVVLLTDGRPTQGDVREAARELADAGAGLAIVRLDAAPVADVLVEEVRAPARVREGQEYDVTVVLRNTGGSPAQAVLTVTADGREVDRRALRLEPGATEVGVPQRAGEGEQRAAIRYEARVSSPASSEPANEVGRAAVRVDGPARVLVYERTAGLASHLVGGLRAGGVRTDVVTALPALDGLLAYDSVVLADVPAHALGDDAMSALDAFVRDAGRGLVVVGGRESYGLGEYDDTPLEDLLPVFARVTDPQRRPEVAQAFVVDTSGSMAACHCRPEAVGAGAELTQGGVVKTEIGKEAVARAIEMLDAQDQVGVLAFDTSSEWVLPLQHVPDQDTVDAGLARLHPGGGQDMGAAIREAIAGLRDVDAKLRHIVLFTDGWTENHGPLLAAAEEAREAGITLSTVGTGEGAFDELRRVANIGGGRFYPGRDLLSIPDILALEVRMVARPVVTEGDFHPRVAGLTPVTEGLHATPPLAGYLATTAKPAAELLLTAGEERDPLLARWRAGLGTTVAWTSDVEPRWSAAWIDWEGFSRFWATTVSETFPADAGTDFDLTATATAAGLRLAVELPEALPADVDVVATVTRPDGTREQVALDRASLSAFEAEVDGDREGVYAVTATLQRGGEELGRTSTTAIRSYSAEYAAVEPDQALLAEVVEVAGGTLDPPPATVFDPAGLPAGAAARELWPWLALLALVLAPVDVGLRRLRLERADWARARDWLRRRGWRRPPRTAERDAATDALFAARERSRRS